MPSSRLVGGIEGGMAASPDPLVADRTAVFVYSWEGRTAATSGGAMGVPAGAISWRIIEALGRLRSQREQSDRGRTWRRALTPLAGSAGLDRRVAVPSPAQPSWLLRG